MLKIKTYLLVIVLIGLSIGIKAKGDSIYYKIDAQSIYAINSFIGLSNFGNGLFFASDINNGDSTKANYLDLWFCLKDSGTNRWAEPQLFSESINSKLHDGPAIISNDGKTIFLTRNIQAEKKIYQKTKTINSLQIFISKKNNDQWSKPQQINFGQNEYSFGHPAITEDGNTLYFISNMPGGYGKTDIYKSTFDGQNWSAPINLGPTVNTDGTEMFPSIYKDTLYFVSDKHNTIGGTDIFKIELSNLQNGKIISLPTPINSSKNEGAILPHSNGYYFISDRNTGPNNNQLFFAEKITVKDTLPLYITKLAYAIKRSLMPFSVEDTSIQKILTRSTLENLKRIEILTSQVNMEADSIQKDKSREILIDNLEKENKDGVFAMIKNEIKRIKEAALARLKEREREIEIEKEKLLTQEKNRIAEQEKNKKLKDQLIDATKSSNNTSKENITKKTVKPIENYPNTPDQALQQIINELEQLYISSNQNPTEALQDAKTQSELNNSFYFSEEKNKLEVLKENVKKEMNKNLSSKFDTDNHYTRLLDIIDAYERDEKNKKK